MRFLIRKGVPEVQDLWEDWDRKHAEGTLSKDERKLFRKLLKAAELLSTNPRHNSLSSHQIAPLSERYGTKVWCSYLENRTPAAGRLFWVYGPGEREITIVGFEPHPEDRKSRAYDRVRLSAKPPP